MKKPKDDRVSDSYMKIQNDIEDYFGIKIVFLVLNISQGFTSFLRKKIIN